MDNSCKSFTALIVDDDNNFATLLKIRLKAWRSDICVKHAETLEQARVVIKTSEVSFNLVILDHNLPDGLGSELFDIPELADSTVLAVSGDEGPDLPGIAIRAGAQHFLGKRQVYEPLFPPLLSSLIERKQMEKALISAKIQEDRMRTIRVLLSTLSHEINNPLGAVLCGVYLLKTRGVPSLSESDRGQSDVLGLIEESSNRIKHVMERLFAAVEFDGLQEVVKGQEEVFHVPGDMSWDEKTRLAEERARLRAKV